MLNSFGVGAGSDGPIVTLGRGREAWPLPAHRRHWPTVAVPQCSFPKADVVGGVQHFGMVNDRNADKADIF